MSDLDVAGRLRPGDAGASDLTGPPTPSLEPSRPGNRLVRAIAIVSALAAAWAATSVIRLNHLAVDPAAAEVLRRAASAALAEPDRAARSDQFVYIESVVSFPSVAMTRDQAGRIVVSPGDPGPRVTRRQRRAWVSVDGTRSGLLRYVPPVVLGEPEMPLPGCHNDPACPRGLRTDLPTTADAMLAWLYRDGRADHPPDVQAFTTIGDLLRDALVPPAAVAAMFAAAARIPGASMRPEVTDVAGRPGIGVRMADQYELIFDAASYAYLGQRGPDAQGQATGSVRTGVGVVDQPGQLPRSD